MDDYIENMLDELPLNSNFGIAAMPASDHLFKVNKMKPHMLDQDTSNMFCTNSAKLLFLHGQISTVL